MVTPLSRVLIGIMVGGLVASSHNALRVVEALEPAIKPLQSPTNQEPVGEALVAQACLHCHDRADLRLQTKSEPEWRTTINQMIWRGAQVLSHEVDPLAAYLAGRRGPDSTDSATNVPLPDGDAKKLIEQACLDCHDLEIIVSQPRSPENWEEVMDRMMELGTQMTETESQLVTEYLVTHWGTSGN